MAPKFSNLARMIGAIGGLSADAPFASAAARAHFLWGAEPDIKVRQELPADLKARTDVESEASLRGHLKAEGAEESGSQSYVPPDEKGDRALKAALDLLRGTITDAAFPPNLKAAVR